MVESPSTKHPPTGWTKKTKWMNRKRSTSRPTNRMDENDRHLDRTKRTVGVVESTTNQPDNVLEMAGRKSTTQKKTSKSTNQSTSKKPIEEVVKVAEQYYRENSQTPSPENWPQWQVALNTGRRRRWRC